MDNYLGARMISTSLCLFDCAAGRRGINSTTSRRWRRGMPRPTVRPLPEIVDPGFPDLNEVFFTDVVVPAENIVGRLNDGWAMANDAYDHVMIGALGYDPARRPPQPATPARDAFAVHRAHVAAGVEIAYVREGVGGTPLLLLHGYPETKRIWWRNIRALADTGFEVIAPDFRGMGESGHPPDDAHDIVTYAKDMHTLVADHLGHASCRIAASDVGGVVATDLVHRFPGFVRRMCIWNTVPPMSVDAYAAAGLDPGTFSGIVPGPTGDYREWQGAHPDELAAMLNTENARRLWVAGMYTSRLWASPGSFSTEDVAFMTEPFAEEARLRAGWAVYQLAHGRAFSEPPMTGAVEIPTLLLYGPDDHVVGPDFLAFAEVAYPRRIGPLVVPGAGHFLQWERADIFNAILPPVLLG